MKSNWIHFNLQFKNVNDTNEKLCDCAIPQEKSFGIYKELICYLKEVIDALSGLVNRYFFLFEPDPHLFLALEVKDAKNINLIKDKVNQIKSPDFVESANIELNTCDETNGEAALDFFQACAKYAFFRATDNYKPGYYSNDETKLIHCFCNQIFYHQKNEIIFYLKCLQLRGFPVTADAKL